MPRRRLAVALLLPEPIDVEVDALRLACGDPTLGRIRPHLTLVPPVNVREDQVDAALAVLRGAAAASRPFTLPLGPPATFLPVNPVLYLAVDDEDGAVRGLRDAVFVPPLARPLSWPFVPHVTLADDAGEPDRLTAAARALAGYRRAARFERVHLLEEQRRESDGARLWAPVADAAFGRPAVVGRGGLELELAATERLGPDAAAWRRDHGEVGASRGADGSLAVTARREGRIIGTAEGRVRGSEAHVQDLLVDPDARGQGVASHLLAAFTAEAARRGASRILTEVPAGGAAAGLFTGRGYVPVATLPAWRGGQDFVALRRDL